MIYHVLLAGLADQDLGKEYMCRHPRSFADTILFLETRETDQKDYGTLNSGKSKPGSSQGIGGISSEQCCFCNQTGHGKRPKRNIRQEQCGAWNKPCNGCNALGHFKVCCAKNKKSGDTGRGRGRVRGSGRGRGAPKKDAPGNPGPEETTTGAVETNEELVTGALQVAGHYMTSCAIDITEEVTDEMEQCSLKHISGSKSEITVPHMMYDLSKGKFIKKIALPHPDIQVSIELLDEGYTQLGYHTPRSSNSGTCQSQAVTDTGAISCCSGLQLMKDLGLTEKDLFPVTATLKGAGNVHMNIAGGMFVNIKLIHNGIVKCLSKQMCYVVRGCQQIYLSHQYLIDFGLVAVDYPNIENLMIFNIKHGEPENAAADEAVEDEYPEQFAEESDPVVCNLDGHGECNCPVRENIPDPPTSLSFPAIPENIEKLKNWIVQ